MVNSTNMKKIYSVIIIAAALCSCQHDIVRETDFNITLDPSNTYRAGEPVRFNIEGEVDNIIFYSGETGSQYKYKDRYSVPAEDVKSAEISLDFQARYGNAGAMEIWVSDNFDVLKGDNGQADRNTMKNLYAEGMPGWEKLDYQEGASTKWTNQSFDLSSYIEKFCIAFHWKTKSADATQRTYWINGSLSLDLAGAEPSIMDISELGFKTVMINEEIEDPYHKNSGNGSIILNNPNTAALIFQGAGANALKYALDGWAVSTPAALDKVANDKAVVIKNLQNYIHTYEYIWEEPGTYFITFVGTNSNFMAESCLTKEMTITIIENLQ